MSSAPAELKVQPNGNNEVVHTGRQPQEAASSSDATTDQAVAGASEDSSKTVLPQNGGNLDSLAVVDASTTAREDNEDDAATTDFSLSAVLEVLVGQQTGSNENVEREVSHAVQYRSLLERYRPLKKRKKVSRKRNVQALAYFAYLEDAVQDLEERLASIEKPDKKKLALKKSSGRDAVGSADEDEEAEDAPFKLQPVFMSLDTYMSPTEEEAGLPRCLIEVCIESPKPRNQAGRDFFYDTYPSRAFRLPGAVMHSDSSKITFDKVERIRIHSDVVNKLLSDILGLSESQKITSYLSHIKPFKALYLGQHGLQMRLDSLAAGRNGVETQSSEDKDLHDRLECVLGFMKNDMKGLTERFDFFRTAQYTSESSTIGFSELWYMFKPGTTIYDPEERQALIVRATRGGRALLNASNGEKSAHWLPPQATLGSHNPFFILATCIGFDGKELGPVHRTHKITMYEGPRKITDLVVYPLQCEDDKFKHGQTEPPVKAGDDRTSTSDNYLSSSSIKTTLEERG